MANCNVCVQQADDHCLCKKHPSSIGLKEVELQETCPGHVLCQRVRILSHIGGNFWSVVSLLDIDKDGHGALVCTKARITAT